MDTATIIILVVLSGAILWVITIYNKLVLLINRIKNGFSQIEVQLKRRYDLIPNLVETAKGYLSHEKETLENVIQARNQASAGLAAAAQKPTDASAIKGLGSAEGVLGNALGRMNVVMEAYPDLKADQNMRQLSEELASTENRVAFSRQAYNDQVTAYNAFKQSFPAVIFAGAFGHRADASWLEFEDSEAMQKAPEISFS